MTRARKHTRSYSSPSREEAAKQTRLAVVTAGQRLFTSRGWAGTTMRVVAGEAGVSLKTVEALFGTKAALLEEVVRFAIRGDLEDAKMPERQAVARMEAAPDARAMLRLHAAHLRAVNQRSAGLAWTVEQAVPSDATVARLWDQMNKNRTYAVDWAASTLLVKPGRRAFDGDWSRRPSGSRSTGGRTARSPPMAASRQRATKSGCAATTRPRS